MQAHGRTADVDRPITYEGLADDSAALLEHLGLDSADVIGYSMGGAAAIQERFATPESCESWFRSRRHTPAMACNPSCTRCLIPTITPEMFAGSPFETTYQEVAPYRDNFPTLVEKLKTLDLTPFTWPDADIQGISAPTMVVIGDADAVRPEHAVQMYRLLGGAGQGDLVGLSNARLAILPGTTHSSPRPRDARPSQLLWSQ